jgi:ActR/RegA family two-component response regulator
MSRAPRRVVAVSGDALRPKLLDALVDDRDSHDVVFVESLTRAYARIRQVIPDLIVVFMRIDDEQGCRLLTMLETDRELDSIPVLTWATSETGGETDDAIGSPVSADCSAWAFA